MYKLKVNATLVVKLILNYKFHLVLFVVNGTLKQTSHHNQWIQCIHSHTQYLLSRRFCPLVYFIIEPPSETMEINVFNMLIWDHELQSHSVALIQWTYHLVQKRFWKVWTGWVGRTLSILIMSCPSIFNFKIKQALSFQKQKILYSDSQPTNHQSEVITTALEPTVSTEKLSITFNLAWLVLSAEFT